MTISAFADGCGGACCATAIDSAARTSNEPRMMRRFMLPSEGGNCSANLEGSRYWLLVVLPVHTSTEQPAAEWPQPAKHVIHVTEVRHFDEIAVEILHKKERVAARRALRPADALHAFADQIVVPALQVTDVEGNVRQADLVPAHRPRRELRLEFENLEHAAAGNPYPSNFAGRRTCPELRQGVNRDLEEGSYPFRWRVGHTHQRAAKHFPVELHRAVAGGLRDSAVAEGTNL